jgi:PTS system nitrogen regulatory IIA component
MIIEQSITFIIDQEGFTAWKVKRLKKLAGFFHSMIVLRCITTAQIINIKHSLEVMSMGCKKNDLCQLRIEGVDAELTCMVLTEFIAEHFDIVNTFHKYKAANVKSIIQKHPALLLPFSINYYFEKIAITNETDKRFLISKISSTVNKKITQAIIKREEISSTGIGHNIAIPHIMVDDINEPTIVVYRLDKAIRWGLNLGEVTLIIAILIPSTAY